MVYGEMVVILQDIHFLASHQNNHDLAEKAKQAAEDISATEPGEWLSRYCMVSGYPGIAW